MKIVLLMALVATFAMSCPKSDITTDKKENTIAQEYALFNTSKINALQAMEIVKKIAPDAKIVEVELEEEEIVTLVWEVEYFSNKEKYEIYIDAKTGKVIKTEKEDDK